MILYLTKILLQILSPVLHEPSSTNPKAQTHAPITHTDWVPLLHPKQVTKYIKEGLSCHKICFDAKNEDQVYENTKVKKMVVN